MDARVLALGPHPAHPAPALRIGVSLGRARSHLRLDYRIEGNISALCLPAPRPARIADRLWEHTCCEAFVACPGEPAYHEINLSPAGEWAVFAFSAYRQGRLLDDPGLDPHIRTQAIGEALVLTAHIDLAALAARYTRAPLEIGISAVIETAEGRLSYWALAHPGERPDFHRRAAFCASLEPPPVA